MKTVTYINDQGEKIEITLAKKIDDSRATFTNKEGKSASILFSELAKPGGDQKSS